MRLSIDEGDRFSSNCFFGADRADPLHRLCLYMNVADRYAERFGNPGFHGRKVRQEFRSLCKDIGIDIRNLKSLCANRRGRFFKKFQTGHTFEPGVCIRKQFTDITECARAEQSVRDRVAENITVGMADEPLVMRDFHSTDNQLRSRSKRMQVETNPHSKLHLVACSSSRKTRARVRSEGLV